MSSFSSTDHQRVAAVIVPDLVGRYFGLYPVVLRELKKRKGKKRIKEHPNATKG